MSVAHKGPVLLDFDVFCLTSPKYESRFPRLSAVAEHC